MKRLLPLALLITVLVPASAGARYRECGDPSGPARNVTADRVACSDARAFARKVADRRVTRSRTIALPGWRAYRARVRHANSGYDVRARRGKKVIRFQYTLAGGEPASNCDPNYTGACLDPSSPDYDCAGGSGNGPDYTRTVRVVGDDHFGLDADGDGVGCE